ncbi:polysaccharide pyruvyl transferase family protein [uncultured Salinisphaera sp.]|uniref:polysaccharide pyruvyl transferase family protein n=1 Tax=uncultured Salinisphaera sp. TaxID=359372 RepID=UPI0032B2DD42
MKSFLSRLPEFLPPGRPVVYFDYAVYSNVGDLLIHKATEAFFSANGNRVIDAFSLQNYGKALKRRFAKDAILVFQGGGNLGDLFPRHDRLRLDVLNAFPSHAAVVLPQTAYYSDHAQASAILSAYADHPRLEILLRDTRSLDLVTPHLPGRAHLMPDMAHVLQNDAFVHAAWRNVVPRGDLDFMREPWTPDAGAGRPTRVGERDIRVWNWPEYLLAEEWRWIEAAKKRHRRDARRWHTRGPLRYWRPRRDRILTRALAYFAAYECIHTNRLHGSLIGLLCNRRVVMYDTAYGKLAGYYHTWLADDNAVTFGGALDRATV